MGSAAEDDRCHGDQIHRGVLRLDGNRGSNSTGTQSQMCCCRSSPRFVFFSVGMLSSRGWEQGQQQSTDPIANVLLQKIWPHCEPEGFLRLDGNRGSSGPRTPSRMCRCRSLPEWCRDKFFLVDRMVSFMVIQVMFIIVFFCVKQILLTKLVYFSVFCARNRRRPRRRGHQSFCEDVYEKTLN